MYERVLLPVDGSEVSTHAARRGFELARLLGSEVILLFVIDMAIASLPDAESGLANYEVLHKTFKEQGEKVLGDLAAEGKGLGLKLETHISEGDVHEEIVKYADEKKAGLIIMGTHGRRGINRLLLGSVAESVARRAHCAVLLIRPEQ